MSARQQRVARISVLHGWFLDRCVHLDEQCPGFAAHVLKASTERRHVLATWLSTIRDDNDIGDRLRWATSAGHDAILRDALGTVPSGYRATLSRSGREIQPPRYYRYLWLVLHRSDPSTIRAVRQTAMLDHERLLLIRTIPQDLREPTATILNNDVVRDLSAAIAQLERCGLSRVAMISAFPRGGSPRTIARFLLRWSHKLALPPHPVPAAPGYRPAECAADLRHWSSRHHNCLNSYVGRALEGRVAFAEVEVDGAFAIVELVHHTGGWVIEGVWGAGNRPPLKAVSDRAVAYLARHNIHRRDRRPHPDHPWSAYRRLTRRWEGAEDA